MTNKKTAIQIPENGNVILYTTDDGKSQVAMYSRDGRVWLNQNQISDLFATSRPNITMHIANILEEGELEQYPVCKDFLLTGPDGKNYNVQYYSLENCPVFPDSSRSNDSYFLNGSVGLAETNNNME